MSSAEKQSLKIITGGQLDDCVDKNNCSYNEAFDILGVTPDQVELGSDDYKLINKLPETARTKKPNPDGVHVDIGNRALYLLKSIDSFSGASRVKGFAKAIESKEDVKNRYADNPDKVTQIIGSRGAKEGMGKAFFLVANGTFAEINAIKYGYPKNKAEIDSSADRDLSKFKDKYIGYEQRNERKSFRDNLRNILEQQNEIKKKKLKNN